MRDSDRVELPATTADVGSAIAALGRTRSQEDLVAAGHGLLGGLALIPVLTRNITRYVGSTSSIWN